VNDARENREWFGVLLCWLWGLITFAHGCLPWDVSGFSRGAEQCYCDHSVSLLQYLQNAWFLLLKKANKIRS
jgi:hypothetical protein